jgi:hypothetical protein
MMEFLGKTKKELVNLAKEAGLIDIEEAEVDLLKRYVEIKSRMDYDKAYIETIQSAVVSEIQKYPERSFKLHGREVSTMESSTQYDFLNTGDIEYCMAEQAFNEAKARLDERKKFLKTLKGSVSMVDDDSGEVYRVTKPVKTSHTVPKIS